MNSNNVLKQIAPGSVKPLSKASTFILEHGWAALTVRHYGAAVNRYFSFMKETKPYPFPSTSEAIYDFICWCRDNESRSTVLSSTTRRYLTGLRMWHVLHDEEFPRVNDHRVRLLLKAAQKTESRPAATRKGFTLIDIHQLVKNLNNTSVSDLVMRGVILVGFWGLARLGELTHSGDHPDVFIRRKDVHFNSDKTHVRIRIRMAKTAAPGEYQFLRLSRQPNTLDPISAITDILRSIPGSRYDALFPSQSSTGPIRRAEVIAHFGSLEPLHGTTFSGHSLRIGGASLRAHYNSLVKSLQRAGRWKSSCYKRYIHQYDRKTSRDTKRLASKLKE